eukprot:2698262-Pleurochrysis_carterae.AAC.3
MSGTCRRSNVAATSLDSPSSHCLQRRMVQMTPAYTIMSHAAYSVKLPTLSPICLHLLSDSAEHYVHCNARYAYALRQDRVRGLVTYAHDETRSASAGCFS